VLRLALAGLVIVYVVLEAFAVEGAALMVLLGVVTLAAVVVLQAVADVVDGERSRAGVVPIGLALLFLVAAGATRTPELALGCFVCLGIEQLRLPSWARPKQVAEG
jgi:hypothetical protein